MKVGIIIPCTSYQRNWATVEESYLYNVTLKTFLLTYDKDHNYMFFIGIDRGDRIYDNEANKEKLTRFCSVMKNINIVFTYMDGITKGHLTVMWNVLFEKAYEDQCDYFFQCGDDIKFTTKGWINDCIKTLKDSDNIGLTGPINNNARILTQSFVSRKHMDLFGYYFPPEIINWCCDDWINFVYMKMNKFYPLRQHFCDNIGGRPRYQVNNEPNPNVLKMRKHAEALANRDLERANKN